MNEYFQQCGLEYPKLEAPAQRIRSEGGTTKTEVKFALRLDDAHFPREFVGRFVSKINSDDTFVRESDDLLTALLFDTADDAARALMRRTTGITTGRRAGAKVLLAQKYIIVPVSVSTTSATVEITETYRETRRTIAPSFEQRSL